MGAPNVGKSSLVNVLSSGVPEVCDYPFTTRSIKMGHLYVNGQRHQVHLWRSVAPLYHDAIAVMKLLTTAKGRSWGTAGVVYPLAERGRGERGGAKVVTRAAQCVTGAAQHITGAAWFVTGAA